MDGNGVEGNGDNVEFNEANPTKSFNSKAKIISQTAANGRKDVKIAHLKYLSNFWRTLETPLVNCEITFILTWSDNCVTVSNVKANQGATFSITDTKLYVPVLTLSIEDNAKLLQQLKSGFKRKINWNKH